MPVKSIRLTHLFVLGGIAVVIATLFDLPFLSRGELPGPFISLAFLFVLLSAVAWRAEVFLRRANERHLEFAASAARAHAASRAKSELVASMSHELRTHLNAILGFSEMIRTRPAGQATVDRDREFAQDIHSAGLHLLSVVSGTLDMARAEIGSLERSGTNLDAGGLAEDVVNRHAGEASVRGIDLGCDIPPAPATLYSDEGKLRQILSNLVSNAIKFTPQGGRVRVIVRHGESQGSMRIEVVDTGVGMRPHDVPTALAPFGRVESGLARSDHGSGLGLPLSHKLAELLDGHLEVHSKPGNGTTISVTLPQLGAAA